MEEQKKEKRKRTQIAIDIEANEKTRIRIAAARWNISMNQWIRSAIRSQLKAQKLDEDK